MRRFVLIAMFVFAATLASAQTSSEISPEDAAKLRKEYAQLTQRIDSIQKALTECRSNYDSDPDKYGAMIVSLEGQLYEANQKHSILSRRIATIPGAKTEEEPKTDKSFSGRNISDSPFFVSNVSKQDLEIFRQAGAVYSLLNDSKAEIDSIYGQLQEMKEKFDKTDSQDEVDKWIIESENIKKAIVESDSEVNSRWSQYYNARIENYLVMIDRLGNVSRSELESLDLLARKAQSSVDPDETLAPSIADFNAQNMLIFAYEKILAEKLGYTKALDSIRKEEQKYSSAESILYPDIEFPYRTTCVYGVPSLGQTYSYSTPDEIPEVKVPTTGVYYCVQLYTSQTPVRQLSTFKGAQPLQKCKSGSYYKYLAGGFRTYAEAYKSLVQMQKSFNAPRIVAWLNGQLTTNDKAKLAETQSSAGGYSIKVKSSHSSTASVIKDVIEIHAPGKQWTSTDSPTGEKLYQIMSFGNKDEAAVIAQIIRTKDSSAQVEVVEN